LKGGHTLSLIGDGMDILKLVDKGVNADLYRQLGEWIDRVLDLQKQNDVLSTELNNLKEQLRFKGRFIRVGGHTFVDGDDEEVCSRCAQVDNRPVYVVDMLIDKLGRRAACPHCKAQTGLHDPLRRTNLEQH
jgi:hypothetical protein